MNHGALVNAGIDPSHHTVLVVDDNPATRHSTSRLLRAAGFVTLDASSGLEALELIALGGLSAVVLDVLLPDIDGFEVCVRLRSAPATALLPVIHLSALLVENADRVTGLNAGADAYLVHPVDSDVLVATLRALIRARTAEENHRRSDARFRVIFKQALSGIALIDAQGRFADVNPALGNTLGRSREELLGRRISDFVLPQWVEYVGRRMVASADVETAWQGDFPMRHAQGNTVHIQWRLSPHVEPGLRVGIAIDVSERQELARRKQEVLEREQAARATAERHSRTKDDFIAVLSHELRTPLNAISGWVHILKKRGAAHETLAALDAIDSSVRAQARIISDTLDMSRINSGKLRLERQRCDAGKVVLESLEGLEPTLRGKNLRLELILPPEEQSPAFLDPTRLQQIVRNLLTNAIEFSEDGGVIKVSLSRTNDVLTLSVQDFGRGVEPDSIAHVFDGFSESDSPDNRAHGGLGLGLSLVRQLAQLHGGEATAESAGLDHGATLTVTMEVGEPAAGARHLTPTEGSKRTSSADKPLEGVDVLVVEDNTEAGEMLALVLGEAGAHVSLAADYDSAVEAVRQAWPAVLVSDIGLPGRDGYELVRTLRALTTSADRPAVLAIALTAFARPLDKRRALEAGFDLHLEKPLQPHTLIAAIATAGSSHSGYGELL